jgi:hypothetical protein
MAQPATLPEQSQAVDHLPTQLPAIPSDVSVPDTAADHIADIDFSHLPDWFPSSSATAQNQPAHIPPPPPIELTLPPTAAEHLALLPDTANIPEWFVQ